MNDSKVLKLLFFAYKDKIFNAYEKIILVAHWALVTDYFLVKDKPEDVRNDPSSMNVHYLLINRRISSLTTIAMRMVMCKSVMSKKIFRSKPVFFMKMIILKFGLK